MTTHVNTDHAITTKHDTLRLEDEFVTAEEITLVEEFAEINRTLARSPHAAEMPTLHSDDALVGWGYDIAERLNSGELSLDMLNRQFRLNRAQADMVQFAPVGSFELQLVRDALDQPWHQHVKHLSVPPGARTRTRA